MLACARRGPKAFGICFSCGAAIKYPARFSVVIFIYNLRANINGSELVYSLSVSASKNRLVAAAFFLIFMLGGAFALFEAVGLWLKLGKKGEGKK